MKSLTPVDCPSCGASTIQNKETKWECEECAYSWDSEEETPNE